MALAGIDLTIVVIYAIALFAIAQWVSREQTGHQKDAADYFLAGRGLPWWAIGTSLIAANISAEQIIGMSGSGYAIGLAIASYEWMAAITLILVGKFLLPVFLKTGIYTMPQFLEQRYDGRVRTVMAVFWLGVYVLVNLTSILWLGALAMNTVAGVPLAYALVLLGAFAVAYSLYGGLKAVALTDIIQVVLLVLGGLLIAYTLLNLVSDGAGVIAGFQLLMDQAPEKFDMIFEKGHPHYADLPGLSVLLGGMWIMNVSYWGFNQYIIQRALAAKSVNEAQKGIVFAAFLKLLMPVIVVLPGIAMFVLNTDLASPDQAYPSAMTLLPVGIKGLVFAALLAAIVSSLASMCNSISTIFTVDIAPSVMSKASLEGRRVIIGRTVSVVAMIIAMITAKPLLGDFDQAFQYIQEFTGFFTPGIVVIFLLGMFWRKTTASAALMAAVGSALLSVSFKIWMPELPFIDRVGVVFLLCAGIA
ncbi:MAG: sodium/sugar symporter, partial [Halieaceae bacterium]